MMSRRVGPALLWILAAVSVALLIYELTTLIGSVLRPLIANPLALQTDFHYYYDAAVRFSDQRGRLYLPGDDVIAGFAYPPPAILPFMWLSGWPLGTALLGVHHRLVPGVVRRAAAMDWLSQTPRLQRRPAHHDRGHADRLRARADLHERDLRPGQCVRPGVRGRIRQPGADGNARGRAGAGDRHVVEGVSDHAGGDRIVGSPDVAGVGVVDRRRDRDRHRASWRSCRRRPSAASSSTCCRRASTRPRFTSRISRWSRSSNDSGIPRRSSSTGRESKR